MKVKDIVLGEEYAVEIVMPAAAGMPGCKPVVFATCVDTAGATVILEYPRMVPDPNQPPSDSLLFKAGMLGGRRYVPGKRLVRVQQGNVLCPRSEFTPPPRDGRIDGDEPVTKSSRVAQRRFAVL